MNKNIIVLSGLKNSGKVQLSAYCKELGIPEIKYIEGEDKLFNFSTDEVVKIFKSNNTAFVLTDYNGYKQMKDFYNGTLVKVYMVYIDVDFEIMLERGKLLEKEELNEEIKKEIIEALISKSKKDKDFADFIIDNNRKLTYAKAQLDYILMALDKEIYLEILSKKYTEEEILKVYMKKARNWDNKFIQSHIDKFQKEVEEELEELIEEDNK